MLASIGERVLKSYLSRWLSVTESHLQVLSLGVWSGRLHFEQLHMLSSVLDELQLPLGLGVKLKKGMIGSLQINCNWARLTTQPVEIVLRDVYLLGEIDPSRLTDPTRAAEEIEQLIDPDVIRTYLHSQKQKIIEAAEQTWEQFKTESGAANQSYMSAMTASLVASILDNLSVTVQRIHVCIATSPRPEPMETETVESLSPSSTSPDLISPQATSASSVTSTQPSSAPPSGTHPHTTFAPTGSGLPSPSAPSPSSLFPVGWSLGVLLNELSFHTTDKAGVATFVKSTGAHVYKRVRLEGLAVYLSSNATPLPDASAGSDQYFMRIMSRPFRKSGERNQYDDEVDDSEQDPTHRREQSESITIERTIDSDSATSDSDSDDATKRDLTPPGRLSTSPVIIHSRDPSGFSRTSSAHGTGSESKSSVEQVSGLEYILAPFDATVKLRVSKNRSHDAAAAAASSSSQKRAKLSVSVEVEKLQLEFTSKQYEIIQALAANISSSEHALRHAPFIAPRMRPGHSQQVTRAWWSYALQVTRKECRERLQQWRPDFIMAYRRAYHAYTPLYTALINGRITSYQRTAMTQLEDAWEAHHIIMWRSLIQKSTRIKEAIVHVSKTRGKKKAKGKQRTASDGASQHPPESRSVMGWLGSWLPTGGGSEDAAVADADPTSVHLSVEEREQILSMLGYDPYASIDQLQSTENAIKVDFVLGKASITLFQASTDHRRRAGKRIDPSTLPTFPLAPRSPTTRQAFLHASLDDLQLQVQQSAAGVAVEFSLDHLLLEDRMASCDRFSALIVPRAHQAVRSRGRPDAQVGVGPAPLWQTPQQRQRAIPSEASPLFLPNTSSHDHDDRASNGSGFASGSPDFGPLSVPDPPLLQMRLSYHFPSAHLTSAPTSSQAHVDLWLATQPLDVVYSAGAIASLQTFFKPTQPSASDPSDPAFNVLWQELEVAAMNAFQDLKRRSAAKLEYVMHHHVRIGLDINIQAPTLIIHHHSAADLGSCLAINLGHVTCVTQEKHAHIVVEPEDEASMRRSSIDGNLSASSSSLTSPTFNLGASMEAAVAREQAGSTGQASTTAGISPEARQELFYDQFHLTIENVDVQLVPLQLEPRGLFSTPGSTAFGPGSDPTAVPALHLPAAAQVNDATFPSLSPTSGPSISASPPSARSARRGGARRAWLARRRHLQSRTTRGSVWGCGPVIDAFTPTVHIMSSVLPSDTSLPRMKIHGHLPPMRLHLSSAKMRRIIDIFASFPRAAPPPAPIANAQPPPLQRSGSLGVLPQSSPSSRRTDSKPSLNRRSSSSFQLSRESAMATAAQVMVHSRKERESKNGVAKLPADWVMLHFHLTASQLAIDLSFDCEVPMDQMHTRSEYDPSSPQPVETNIELVNFLLDGVDLSFTRYPYSFELATQVHGLHLEDCINREHSQYRYLISSGSSPAVTNVPAVETTTDDADSTRRSSVLPTPAAPQAALTDLIYLRLHHATDSAPTAMAAAVNSLRVDINTLQFNWNRSTFGLLMEFVQPALDAMAKPTEQTDTPEPHHAHSASYDALSDADIGYMSRSVDFSSSQLHLHSHSLSNPNPLLTNMSASISSLPVPPTPDRVPPTINTATPATPTRSISVASAPTPSSAAVMAAAAALDIPLPTQQELLARITEKISNDGEIGSRANRSKLVPSSSSLHVQARVNLISLSLNAERDDSIASIATTEIHGLDVSVKTQDCPCGGCLQVDATLDNLTLFEITTDATDNFSNFSRRSETRSGRMPFGSNSSLRDSSSSPMHQSETGSMRGGSSGISFGASHTHARRIASKRHASDTALVSFSMVRHALVIDAPIGSPSSAACPIRFRTIRNTDAAPPVDPASLSFDQTIAVNVSSIQVVFVPEFVVRLQTYLEESRLKEASDRAAEKAKAALSELQQQAEANCSLLKYAVAIDNPLIFIPHTTTAPINHPIHAPPPASSSSTPASPRDAFHMHLQQQHHLYDDVRAITDYLVLDLGKISLANQFELSEERHPLVPAPDSSLPLAITPRMSPPPRRRRKSISVTGRVPTDQLQLRLSAMNLILASHDARADSAPQSDDAGEFWLSAHKIKIFEDVDVRVSVTRVLLQPHLAFVDVPQTRVAGTVSTIHAHISEQLLTFLLGVYTVELAPLLAPEKKTQFEDDFDEMMETEFEQEEVHEWKASAAAAVSQTPAPRAHSERHTSIGSVSSISNSASTEVDLLADAMASIDEELDDEVDPSIPPVSHTVETVNVTVDLSFEGVLLDLMLMPSAQTRHDDDPAMQQPRPARGSSISMLSPSRHTSSSSSSSSTIQPPPLLNGFSFAPVPPLSQPVNWWSWSQSARQSQSFAQIRAQTLQVSFQLTSIVRTQADAEPMRSALTSVELSLGHLALEDVRAECSHPMLRQVIGGHHDATDDEAASQTPQRPVSVAFDQASTTPQSSPAGAASSRTVLPDLKVKFESLALERVRDDPSAVLVDINSVPAKENVTVESSIDVEFTAPRLVISPDFLRAVAHFVDAYTEILDTKDDAQMDARSMSGSHTDPQSSDETESPRSSVVTRIHARIRDPQVWLMSDGDVAVPAASAFAPSPDAARPLGTADLRESSREFYASDRALRPLSCVVLRCNLEVEVKIAHATAVRLTLADIEALMCYRANQLKLAQLNPLPVPVFQPFAVTVDYQLKNSAAEQEAAASAAAASVDSNAGTPTALDTLLPPPSEHHVTVEVGRLDSCFSFLQTSSGLNIILALVRAIPSREADEAAPPKSKPTDTPAVSPMAFLTSFKGVVQLRTSGIHLKLVNDAPGYYVPLLSFTISPLVLSILDTAHDESVHFDQLMDKTAGGAPSYLPAARFSSGLPRAATPRSGASLMMTTGVQANYYNQQLGEWEKFLDTWLFDVRADEATVMVSSKQVLELQVTPSCMHALAQGVDSLQTHLLAVLAADAKPAKRKKSRRTARGGSLNNNSSSSSLNAPSPSPTQMTERKASYFRVRNETGSRLRFWSVEVEQSGSGASSLTAATVSSSSATTASKSAAAFTVDPNEEQTVALRQYIGVGGFGLESESITDANEIGEDGRSLSDAPKPRWLYRSPMVGLQLEAGQSSDRWHAWQPINAVPLVAGSAEAASESSRQSSARNRLQAHANLTLHPLLPSPELDSPSDVPEPEEVAGSVIACHLVSQTDADGSVAQVLVVSSALLLVNRTFVDIEICLVDTVAEQVLFQRIVHSGQSLPMPVLLVNWRRVKLLLRPAGTGFKRTEWSWSTAGFRLSLLAQEAANHTILKCRPHATDFPLSPLQSAPQTDDQNGTSTSVFCCGLNIFSTGASADIAQTDASSSISQIAGMDASIDPTLYTIALDPPLAFKNLLGCDVSYQVTLRERLPGASYIDTTIDDMAITGRHAGFLPHRQEVHWYHMDLGVASSAIVTLQLGRGNVHASDAVEASSNAQTPRSNLSRATSHSRLHPFTSGVATDATDGGWSEEWSSEVVIHSTSTSALPSTSLVLQDREGARLGVQLDYSATPHHDTVKSASASVYPYAHAGHGLVTASVPYWFSNRSGLPLVYASLDESEVDMVQRCAGQSTQALQYDAQALMDLEGLDELSQRHAAADAGSGAAAVSHDSWFHFRHARLEFGTETRSGLQALIDDPEHGLPKIHDDWRWTPELVHQPLDENVFLLSPVERTSSDEDSTNPSVEVYLLPSQRGEKLRAVIRLPNTDWSQPFNVDTVGWDGALQLTEQARPPLDEDAPTTDSAYDLPRPDRPLRVYSLGVSICMHSHLRYARTKIIQFAPRYVLSNQTLHTLEFRQTDSHEVRTIAPKQQVPIHWLDQGGPAALSLRVASYGWQWAAKRFGIALESVGVFSVRLRNSHTHDTAVLHVWIKLVGATFEITVLATWEPHQRKAIQPPIDAQAQMAHIGMANASLSHSSAWPSSGFGSVDLSASGVIPQVPTAASSADDRDLHDKMAAETSASQEPVPYRIENCSLRTLLFHQSDEPKLKQRLLPFQSCPYAWDEPMGRKEIVLFCLSDMGANRMHDDAGLEEQRVGSYPLDKIARYDPVWLRSTRRHALDERQVQDQVVAQVYVDGRVRVLKLVELTYANSAGLNPTQASLNAKAVDDAMAKQAGASGWSVELRLAGVGLSLITHVQRSGAASAPAFVAPVSATSVSHLRSSTIGASSSGHGSAHPLALLGVPYTRQELLYLSIQSIRVRLHQSTANQTVKAAIGHIQLDNQLHSAVYPVVLCSVSKPNKQRRWFSAKKRQHDGPSDLDLEDEFFHLTPAGGAAAATSKSGRGRRQDILPCWFSISMVKSNDRSTEGLLFLPGLAVRMQLLKINVEEKLINQLIRFSELLRPAIALMAKPNATNVTMAAEDGPHHFSAPVLERQSSQALLEIALRDGDFGNSPVPLRIRARTSLPPSDIDDGDITRPGSMTPSSLTDSIDEEGEEVEDMRRSRQFTGIVGRLSMPPNSDPLSSLEYTRAVPMHDLDRSDEFATSTAVSLPPKKLERPFILYFQHLLVETIEIQVSMSSSGDQDDAIAGGGSHPLRVLLRAVGATLLNFEDASLKFGSLDLPDVFASGEELAALVQLHYMKQATRQAYHLLGSSDFLGNPVALFGAISTGFGELVYQPVAGLTQSPAGVVTGAFSGIISFSQHAIYGVTSATRSILSSIGKGLSSASMSEQHRGTAARMRLAELPMRGWRRGGLLGFLGGSVRAWLGLTGSFASGLSSGVDRIRALVNPLPKLLRAREPLFFQSGMKPRLFNIDVARFVAAYLAMHQEETFVACVEQESMTTNMANGPSGMLRDRLFGGRSLSGHQTFVAQDNTPGSTTPTSPTAASSSMASILNSTPIRAPSGARVCVLLTTQTLVVFCVFSTPASSSRRPASLLREIPLEMVTPPVVSHANHTVLTLEPLQEFEMRSRRDRRFRGMRERPPPPHLRQFPAPSIMRVMFPFFFAPLPTTRNESVRLPVHCSNQIIAQLELLSTAARASWAATMRARGQIGAQRK